MTASAAGTTTRLRRAGVAAVLLLPPLLLLAAIAPSLVLAHGGILPPEPTVVGLVLGWSFDPLPQIAILGAAVAYWVALRRVNAAHPYNHVPLRRPAYWLVGLVVLEVALQGGIEAYDTTLFSIHMVQHMLIVLVVAPLLVLGAPITLLLRVASPEDRRRFILPILHSRVVRVIGHPVFAWVFFTAVMWGSHVTPLFDAALEQPLLHDLEHALYLASALLFWWPVAGVDPSPYRMSYPARLLYLFLQMPQNTFLALTLYSAAEPLYSHYVTLQRPWGPTPLLDQQAAAAIMWVWGDLTFLVAMLLVLAAWLRADEARTLLEERRADAAAAAAADATLASVTPEAAGRTGGPGEVAGIGSAALSQASGSAGSGAER